MRDYASLSSKLLSDLGLISENEGFYRVDSSPHYAARVSLATSFVKKLCPDGNTEVADLRALEKFKALNGRFLSTPFEFVADNEAESCFYDYFVDHLNKAVGEVFSENESGGLVVDTFDLEKVALGMGVGPGANQGADSSCMVNKLFESPMTYTNPELISLYRGAASLTGLWAEAEMSRFHRFGFEQVRGGKIFFAAKNAEISRTCCTEPLLNMIIQKSVGSFLEARLGSYFGISLSDQPDLNREMARIGSSDGSFCTIDLASASDCIGLGLLTKVLRNSPLKRAIMLSRCERAVYPDGTESELGMVSTMGNGFTFPLMTMIFAAAVRATYDLMDVPSWLQDGTKNFGVFGDDICAVSSTSGFLIRMITKLGFIVNVNKSFTVGPFRESCGYDYFMGVNIRGVYLVSAETHQQVCSAINRLNRWSAVHGISLSATISLLYDWISEDKILLIPRCEGDDAGIHVPFKATRPKVDDAYWFKYRMFTRRLKRLAMEELSTEDGGVNSLGQGVGFLSGHLRRRDVLLNEKRTTWWSSDHLAQVTLREPPLTVPRYKVTNKSTPFWDYHPDDTKYPGTNPDGARLMCICPFGAYSFSSWEATVAAALPF